METPSVSNQPIPTGLLSGQQSPEVEAWQRIECLLIENFHDPDIEAAKAFFACIAAHTITSYPMVWPMLIAPPGSMKTVLLQSLAQLPRIHFADEVTPHTFISGQVDKKGKTIKKASFLHRIGSDGVLVNADFSTVLSGDPHKRLTIFAQLRRIYDGYFSREFGADAEDFTDRHWEGRLTFIAGVTDAVDDYHSVVQQLGERFVRIRWKRAGGDSAALNALAQNNLLTIALREAVHAFLRPIFTQENIEAPEIPFWAQVYIAKLGEETCYARASVPRENFGKGYEISGPPQIESNTRLPQQLAQMARGWALLNRRSEVALPDLRLAERVANDSVPPIRRAILDAHAAGQSLWVHGYSGASIKRALEELRWIELLPPESGKLKSYPVNAIPD